MNKNLFLSLLGIGVGGIGFGLVTPATVLLLEQNGVSSFLSGSVTAIGYLSIILFSKYAANLIDRHGVKLVLIIGLFLWTGGAALHVFWHYYWTLFPVKFIMGIGGTFVFVATEVAVNFLSTNENRNKNLTLYVIFLSAGVAVGTVLIWTTQIYDWLPFAIGSGIMTLVLVYQQIYFEDIIVAGKEKIVKKMSVKLMPKLGLIISILYGMFESSLIVALPIYGLRRHFSPEEVAFFLTSFVMGGILILVAVGNILDKFTKSSVLFLILGLLSILFAVPSFLTNFYPMLVVFFIIGGLVPLLYTVGLGYTIEKIDKKYLAQGNGYYIMLYGIGTILGPLFASAAIEINAAWGYWIFSGLLCAGFLAYSSVLRRRDLV